jgi:hypothetical protein
MRKIFLIGICSLIFLLAAAPHATAQFCPEPGGGAEIVELFKDACDECPDATVVTCRGDYMITLVDISRNEAERKITFIYQVHNTAGVVVDRNLLHWILGMNLDQFQLSLAHGKTLSDLIESCTIMGFAENMDCGLVIPDPTTQLEGQKFEALVGDGESWIFSVVFDETALAPGLKIEQGCVLVATKAGDEDIQKEDHPAPGYACIAGAIIEEGPSEFLCPKSKGYWKNHSAAWPVDSLVLGSQAYSMSELLILLKAPTRGDASRILAKQLIPAKLNIANGSNPDPVAEVIESADELLATFSGKLPYSVHPSTADGHEMVKYARILDAYNNGILTPSCTNRK